MSLGPSTFMDTKQESMKWHKGIFYGLKYGAKVHDPRKLKKHSRFKHYDMTLADFREYYRKDEHYYDVPYVAMYGLTSAIEVGLFVTGAEWAIANLF